MRETGSVAGWNLLLKFPRRINARQIKRKFLLRSGNFVKPLCKFLSSPSCCSPLANCVKPAGKISRPPYRRIEVKLTTRLTMLMHLRSFFFFGQIPRMRLLDENEDFAAFGEQKSFGKETAFSSIFLFFSRRINFAKNLVLSFPSRFNKTLSLFGNFCILRRFLIPRLFRVPRIT